VRAFLPGIYPRSEALVQATRDLDRGRASEEAVDAQVARDLDTLLALQQDAGLDLLADGMLRWQDLFRPLVEASAGLEPGALTRFLDTNTFFRAPRATGAGFLTTPLDERYVQPVPGSRLVTLPSPYALGTAAGVDPEVIAAEVLAPQIEALEAELIVLAEPFLARGQKTDLGALSAALAALPERSRFVLQLTFGDAEPLFAALADLPVAGIGVDFYATTLEAVPEGFPKLLLAGVVDARSSVVEDPERLVSFLERLAERAGAVALVPNGDLQFVSEPVARGKVSALGRAKAIAVGVVA
jgi:5-methyltetrahydropteroyltriglutamate--homocysteine methyltransferase